MGFKVRVDFNLDNTRPLNIQAGVEQVIAPPCPFIFDLNEHPHSFFDIGDEVFVLFPPSGYLDCVKDYRNREFHTLESLHLRYGLVTQR